MAGLGDLDLDALAERLFEGDTWTLLFGLAAERDEVGRPPGEDRYYILCRLEEAQELWRENRAGPALVVAQSVAEAYFEEAMEALFAVKGADALSGPVKDALRSFQLSRREHLSIYQALSNDRISDAPFWEAYRAGVRLRNVWVHGRAEGHVTQDEAESFILAVVELISHLETALSKAGVKRPTERFQVEVVQVSPKRTEGTVHFTDSIHESVTLAVQEVPTDSDASD